MDTVATQPAADRQALFVETTERMVAASPVIAEKDFWVCFVLRRLFSLDFQPNLLLKGGTSLSKAFGFIHRFSEDIDLTLNRAGLGFTGTKDPLAISGKNARKREIDNLGAACARVVRERLEPVLRASIEDVLGREGWALESVTLEDNSQVDLRFRYPPSLSPEDYGGLSYIQPFVRMEIGATSDLEPSKQLRIKSYAAEHYPNFFTQPDTDVRVLAAERTFWEKATIFHNENHRPPRQDIPPGWKRLSRHAYDLFMLDRADVAERAIERLDLLADVVRYKETFFRTGWSRYAEACPGSFRLAPRGAVLGALRSDYAEMQPMFFGDEPPRFDEIEAALDDLERRINATAR